MSTAVGSRPRRRLTGRDIETGASARRVPTGMGPGRPNTPDCGTPRRGGRRGVERSLGSRWSARVPGPRNMGRSCDQANRKRGLGIRKQNEGDFPRAAGPENWRGGAPNPSPSIAKGTGAAARLPFSVAQPPRRARRGPRGRRPEIAPDAPHARSAAAPMPLGHGNAIRHAHAPLRPAWSAPWPPHARPRATGRMGEWGHTHAAPARGLQHSGQG